MQQLGESVSVGTLETGFNFERTTAVKKDAQVGKILSFNSAYKLILFEVSLNAATMSRPKNACDLLMRSAKTYDQLPTLKIEIVAQLDFTTGSLRNILQVYQLCVLPEMNNI